MGLNGALARQKGLRRLGSFLAALVFASSLGAPLVASGYSPGTTTCVSVRPNGIATEKGTMDNGVPSEPPDVSGDGRYVAFYAYADDLVAGDSNGRSDIFVRDRVAGSTQRVSVSSAGTQGNDDSMWAPEISSDGRYVAFVTYASNLVSGDTNGESDVMVRDRVAGTTTRVSVSSAGTQGNGSSWPVGISNDGRYVAFVSYASNLVANDSNGLRDLFIRDRVAGTTVRVRPSVGFTYYQVNDAAISGDGKTVVFSARRTLAPASSQYGAVCVWDRETGATRVLTTSLPKNDWWAISVADDGSKAAFSGDTFGTYVYDASTKKARYVGSGGFASLSGNGRYLVHGWGHDLLVRDLQTGSFAVPDASLAEWAASAGAEGPYSIAPAISGDGRTVAFYSEANSDDGFLFTGVFAHDVEQSVSLVRTSSSSTIGYGSTYDFLGTLTSEGIPVPGATVVLEASGDGKTFKSTGVSDVTRADGKFVLGAKPSKKTWYRARLYQSETFMSGRASVAMVSVRADIRNPVAPGTMAKSKSYKVWGYLRPRHASGTYPVRIYKWRQTSSGSWKGYGYVKAKASDYAGYSKYSASIRLPYAGTWKLRAYAPTDGGHAPAWSGGYDYVSVR